MLSPVADSLRHPFPEIRLLPDGAFSARDGRPGTLTGENLNAWSLTPEAAETLIARWRRRETPLVIDYEHQSLNARHNGRPAPAAGWIEALRYEPGQGLFAAVRWTEGASAFIGQDEYRFISPVFSFDPHTGGVLELKGAALTNTPALDGLGAVAASEEPAADSLSNREEVSLRVLNRLKRLLGLPEDADEERVLEEVGKLEELLALASPVSPEESPASPPTLLDYVRDRRPEAALSTLERVNAELRDRLSASLTATQGERLSHAIEEAVADGRLSRGLTGWATSLGRRDPEALFTYLDAVAPIAALTSLQTSGGGPRRTPASLSDEERFVCAQLGLSETAYAAVRGKERHV